VGKEIESMRRDEEIMDLENLRRNDPRTTRVDGET